MTKNSSTTPSQVSTSSVSERSAEQNRNNASKQGVEESEKESQQSNQNFKEEKSGKDKKTDNLFMIILKALLKALGIEIKEEEKEENKDVQKMLDELMKLLGLDKEKIQGLQNGSIPQSNKIKSEDDLGNSNQTKKVPENQNSTTTENQQEVKNNEEKSENNNDKLSITIIVGIYEKEGKLDSLKEILNKEKERPENKDNPEIQNLIEGFNAQIKEVEKDREQSVDKEGQQGIIMVNDVEEELDNDHTGVIEGLDYVIEALLNKGVKGDNENQSEEDNDKTLEDGLGDVSADLKKQDVELEDVDTENKNTKSTSARSATSTQKQSNTNTR